MCKVLSSVPSTGTGGSKLKLNDESQPKVRPRLLWINSKKLIKVMNDLEVYFWRHEP